MKQKCEHLDYVYINDSRRFNEKRTNDDFNVIEKYDMWRVVITPEGRDEFLAVSTFASLVDRRKRTTPLNGITCCRRNGISTRCYDFLENLNVKIQISTIVFSRSDRSTYSKTFRK